MASLRPRTCVDGLALGDVIKADGPCLTVEAVHPTSNLMIMDFINLFNYILTPRRDSEVRVRARVGVAL